jgi:hypothetical protein
MLLLPVIGQFYGYSKPNPQIWGGYANADDRPYGFGTDTRYHPT